jgi:hypothetical protein
MIQGDLLCPTGIYKLPTAHLCFHIQDAVLISKFHFSVLLIPVDDLFLITVHKAHVIAMPAGMISTVFCIFPRENNFIFVFDQLSVLAIWSMINV